MLSARAVCVKGTKFRASNHRGNAAVLPTSLLTKPWPATTGLGSLPHGRPPPATSTYLGWLITGFQWTAAVAVGMGDRARRRFDRRACCARCRNRWLSGFATAWVELFFRNVRCSCSSSSGISCCPSCCRRASATPSKQSNPLWRQFIAAMLCLGCLPRRASRRRTGAFRHRVAAQGQKNAGLAMGFRWRRSIATC